MEQNRRDFLTKTGCALGMAALATQFRHFGMMSALAQNVDNAVMAAVPSDYRALVCIFMSGGNDGNNVVIPNHNDGTLSNYTSYSNVRAASTLAIPQASLLPINVPRMNNLSYGLHPNLGLLTQNGTTIVNNGIHELYGLGKMAVVTNVGTLVAPMTRTQYQNGSVQKPFQLFSHSDQVSQYQAGRSDTQSFTGWGGRISDQRTTPDNPSGLIPMITSISGAQLFTAGQVTLPLAIAGAPTGLNQVLNPQGMTANNGPARLTAFNALRSQDLDHDIIEAASHVTDSAMQANAALSTFQEVTVVFPNTTLGNQLKQVARLIKKRGELSINRQVFFCSIGGFDTHNSQNNANNGQVALMTQISQAMRAFYEEMVVQGLSDKVTQFTMSDFSRTFGPAGAGATVGTDHAWANHHFVVGSGITASDFYGINTSNGTPYPTLTMNGPDDADSGTGARGRWIPTTSVEQYAATLARWFGLPDVNMVDVFPKIVNFPNTNLGFMGPP
jgi:uncharacterized protein (DUF1501 family)